MASTINIFTYLLEHWYVILLVVACGLNYKNKALFLLTLVVTVFSLMSIVVWDYIFLLPNSERWFYVFWTAWDVLLIFVIISLRFYFYDWAKWNKLPSIATIPLYFNKLIIKPDLVVLLLSLFNVLLQLMRYTDRHYIGTDFTKPIYQYGMMGANALIVSVLFLPRIRNLLKQLGGWLYDRFVTVRNVNSSSNRHLGS